QLRSEMLELHQHRVRFQSELKHMVESYGSLNTHFEKRTESMEVLPPIPGHAPSPVSPRIEEERAQAAEAESVEGVNDEDVLDDRPGRHTSPGMVAGSSTSH